MSTTNRDHYWHHCSSQLPALITSTVAAFLCTTTSLFAGGPVADMNKMLEFFGISNQQMDEDSDNLPENQQKSQFRLIVGASSMPPGTIRKSWHIISKGKLGSPGLCDVLKATPNSNDFQKIKQSILQNQLVNLLQSEIKDFGNCLPQSATTFVAGQRNNVHQAIDELGVVSNSVSKRYKSNLRECMQNQAILKDQVILKNHAILKNQVNLRNHAILKNQCNFESQGSIALEVLPVLSLLLQINNAKLILNYFQTLRKLLSCVITVRIIIAVTILRYIRNPNNNPVSVPTVKKSSVSKEEASLSMEQNGAHIGVGQGAGDWEEEDGDWAEGAGDDEAWREVPRVPDFGDIIGNGGVEDDMSSYGDDENEVPQRVPAFHQNDDHDDDVDVNQQFLGVGGKPNPNFAILQDVVSDYWLNDIQFDLAQMAAIPAEEADNANLIYQPPLNPAVLGDFDILEVENIFQVQLQRPLEIEMDAAHAG